MKSSSSSQSSSSSSEAVSHVNIADDGRALLVGGEDGSLSAYEIASGDAVFTVSPKESLCNDDFKAQCV